MSKADKDGWIRHRGEKCPVDKGVRVDVRYRDGEISMNQPALEKGDPSEPWAEDWSHDNCAADIMAYKLHKPAEQVVNMEAFSDCVNAFGDSHADVMESVLSRLDGPLQWRDRITEIDSTTQALTTERAELVQKLASEGFALIWRDGENVDSKRWMIGDIFIVSGGDDHDFDVGDKVALAENDGTSRLLFTKDGEESWVNTNCVKPHSRQSA